MSRCVGAWSPHFAGARPPPSKAAAEGVRSATIVSVTERRSRGRPPDQQSTPARTGRRPDPRAWPTRPRRHGERENPVTLHDKTTSPHATEDQVTESAP